jgi:hypothetical protein
MKNVKFLSLFFLSVVVLSACSNDENILAETEQKHSLKSYKVKRDASGAYFLDYELENDVKSQSVKNLDTNVYEFHLCPSEFKNHKRIQSEELFRDGNQLNIGFIDSRINRKSNITIEDDIITLAKKSSKNDGMLSEYSINSNEDGTFNLDFTVMNKVSVEFVYNEIENIYEIHLEKGNSNKIAFSRSLIKNEGEDLKIYFVTHTNTDASAKGKPKGSFAKRKPRIIIDNGNEY